ncbi:MAG: hypothetical protein JW917_05575 [Ignavibacteria bacterium]|nr:hypothetical protein [Ignavibacteria bacterium]
MKTALLKILLIFIFTPLLYGQEKIELKNADQLTGKTEGEENIREATGNVHFVHGRVTVYCNSATQYIDQNRVVLRGNVRIYQDTISLFTDRATYFGNDSKAICQGGVTLKDPNATLRADDGIYMFNEAKAVFTGDVIIINPEYRITAKELTYFRNTEDSFCKGNVVVKTDSSVIKAEYLDYYRKQGKSYAREKVSIEKDSSVIVSDTLTDYANEKKSIASGNVLIKDYKSDLTAAGDYLENYEDKLFTLIKGNARLIQVDEDNDTLFIYSNILEAYREKPEYYIAKDSVNIIRGDFLSKCGIAYYYTGREEEKDVVTLNIEPVVWQKDMQMTADSIYAEILENKINKVYARKLSYIPNSQYSFLISKSDSLFEDRFDQIKGYNITMNFADDKLSIVEVDTNSNGIYYAYDNNKANGMNIISGDFMTIYFDEDQKVYRVKVTGAAKGEYAPEEKLNVVERKLPGFLLREDKPERR